MSGIKRTFSNLGVPMETEDEPALVAEPTRKRSKRSFPSPGLSKAFSRLGLSEACHSANMGDESFCKNIVSGLPCRGMRIAQGGAIGWGDCFRSLPQVSLVLYYSNTLTACRATHRHFFLTSIVCLQL
jgi:hypothetical protein